MMRAVQAFSDKVHARTGVTCAGQAAWMFAMTAGLSGVRVMVDVMTDPLGNPASGLASAVFLAILAPVALGRLIRSGCIQAQAARRLVGVAIGAGGSVDVLLWICQTLTPYVGRESSLSALAGVAVGMAAIYRATLSLRRERVLQAAAEMGKLSARSGSGPFVALVCAALLAVSSSSLMRTVTSCSSVMICISFALALVGGLLLMCNPQPPLSLGSHNKNQNHRRWNLSHLAA